MAKDPDDPTRFEFFNRMKKAQAERLKRMEDVEHRKRWVLACASGGGMRHHSVKKAKITLPKLKILEDG